MPFIDDAPSRYNVGIKSTMKHEKHVFESSRFLEALEAAGYLQRLDTSEERITARYQHALSKMQFAAHSEAFVNQSSIRRVHGSTVQFFNEDPVSDPFVHICTSHLPPNKQVLVTPVGSATSGWTPIGSPDEADGTMHFTVSYPGFWPITVVFDTNPQHLAHEDDFRGLADESESDDQDAYIRSARSSKTNRARSSSRGAARGASYNDYSDSESSTDDDGYATGRSGTGRFAAGGAGSSYSRSRGLNDYGTSENYGGASTNRARSRSRARSEYGDADLGYSSGVVDGLYGGGSSNRRARSNSRSRSYAGGGNAGYSSGAGAGDETYSRARSRSRARSNANF